MILEALSEKGLECTGCSACMNSCPVYAITSKKDDYGFLYPTIDQSACVKCNKCVDVCPVLNFETKKEEPISCYMLKMADDICAISSSGGAFTALSKAIFEADGVVFGAAMESDLSVHHRIAHNEAELASLRKSKYVQSDMGTTVQKVRQHLENGDAVLFVGCPCQIAGLKRYLGHPYEKLWTVDVICHGVSSAQMLRESLAEMSDVAAVDFRDKNYGWECLGMTVIRNDGSRHRLSYNESRYEQGFHPNITLRESCYDCKFCEFSRQGDISIGDFWNVEKYYPEVDRKNGVSSVVVNTLHGEMLIEKARKYVKFLKEMPLKCLEGNRLQAKISKPEEREAFLRLYPKKTFNEAVLYAQQNIHDIGIVGNWSYPNYGTALTYYALYHTLCDMGYTVTMLSWPEDSLWKPYKEANLFKTNPYPAWDIAEIPKCRLDLYQYNSRCNTFVLGSDQLLNNNLYNAFGRFIQMDWVKGNRKKIAYGASFGTDYIWGDDADRAEMAYFLQKFDAFSVRETSGRELLDKYYGVKAQVVIDPVFLLSKCEYDRLISNGKERVPKDPFVFAYILDQTDEKLDQLQRCIEWIGIPMKSVSDAAPNEHQISAYHGFTEYNVHLEEWLAYIHCSEAVITDSFHGTCMAILAGKPFLAISNDSRGIARFRTLLQLFNLEDRLCENANEISEKRNLLKQCPDQKMIAQCLSRERNRGIEWLKDVLMRPLGYKSFSTYDILGDKCETALAHSNEGLSRVNDLERLQRESVTTETKQWEQLEDHRLRLDGADDRLNGLEKVQKESVTTESKQWEQLEDHRLRLDGIVAENNSLKTSIDQMLKTIENLEQQNRDLKVQIGNSEKQLKELERWSILYRIRRFIKEKI